MRNQFLAILPVLALLLAAPCFAQGNTVMGQLNSYTDTTNTTITTSNSEIDTRRQTFANTVGQLQADMNKVSNWATGKNKPYQCGSLGGRISEAVSSANSTIQNDVNEVNGKLQPLVASMQMATADLRGPASVSAAASFGRLQSGQTGFQELTN
jgi:hypothetical protein